VIATRLGAAADEGGVGIIEFAREPWRIGFAGNEAHLADESSAPCAVDAGAKILFHPGHLTLPHWTIGAEVEPMTDAAKGTRMRRELRADHRGPSALDPREGSVRMVDAADDVAEKISCTFHGDGILAQPRRVAMSKWHAIGARMTAARNRSGEDQW
jgi:hypothetical protein